MDRFVAAGRRANSDVVSALDCSPLTDSEFRALRDFIFEKSGITLGDSKRQLVASRLARRLRALGLGSYGAYYQRVSRNDPSGDELRELFNAITTNKTEFFRENHHFEFLKSTVLPGHLARQRRTGEKRFRVWSAGCSSGEEVYSLAMTLHEVLPAWMLPAVEIVATDLDTNVLARAQAAIYDDETVAAVPASLQRRYFLRGTGENDGKVRVIDSLRAMVTFGRVNFIERPWPVSGPPRGARARRRRCPREVRQGASVPARRA